MNTSKEEIFLKLKNIFVEMFALAPEKITREATLFDDLDIDSIDAIDLLVRLEEFTPNRLTPDEFKKIRNVGDIVETLYDIMQRQARGAKTAT